MSQKRTVAAYLDERYGSDANRESAEAIIKDFVAWRPPMTEPTPAAIEAAYRDTAWKNVSDRHYNALALDAFAERARRDGLEAGRDAVRAAASLRLALVDLIQCVNCGCDLRRDPCWFMHIEAARRALTPPSQGGEG